MTAEIRNDVMVATEDIKAPPEVVIPYFTNPALIVEWIGNRAELDRRPAACSSSTGRGRRPRCLHRRRAAVPRSVQLGHLSGCNPLAPGASTVEVALTPDADDTMVVLTHRGLPSTHVGNHRAGWEHRLGRLLVAAG